MNKTFLVLLFVLFGASLGVNYYFHAENELFDLAALNICSVLMLAITFVSYFLLVKVLGTKDPHFFVNGVYASMFVKLMVFGGAIFFYIWTHKKTLFKPSIYLMLTYYFLFMMMETVFVFRHTQGPQNKPNA